MRKIKFEGLTPKQVLPALWNAADHTDSHVRALKDGFATHPMQPLTEREFTNLCFLGKYGDELDGMFYDLLVDALGLRRADFERISQNGDFAKKKFDPAGYDQKFGAGKAKSVINELLRQNRPA